MPNKSLTVKMPNLRSDLIRHFIRGYFDGDGCIYYANNERLRYEFSIVGGDDMLDAINDQMQQDISKYEINHSKAVKLSTANKNKIIAIYHYLYDNSNIYLRSKKEQYERLLSLFAEMQSKNSEN